MLMTDMQLRHGKLLYIQSQAMLNNGWRFVVAAIELEGTFFEMSFPFADTVDRLSVDDRLADLFDEKLDAIWVRARLKSIFGVDSAPETVRIEKSLSSYSFVAVRDNGQEDAVAVPFECSDYYGKTGLYFSPHELDADLKASVAGAFWQLVGGEARLADFEDRAFHSGASVWMSYGCKGGDAFYNEEEDEYNESYSDPEDAG
jgi:hypothetical protein